MSSQATRPPANARRSNTPGHDSSDEEEPATTCLSCAERPVEYQSPICRHPSLCKRCAMKQATGGKCKVCGDVFGELQRV